MALTQVDGGLLSPTNGQFYGFKSRIINGAMVIDQRNAGASVTPTSGQYLLDRYYYSAGQASKFTAQQNAGSVTPPIGFSNYLGMTVGASANVTIVSGDYFQVNQRIEGFNTADLAWGTANAQTVTLSFWVRSSLTGTFGGSITNSAGNRSYVFSYTISSANTWEQKSVTIAGDTTGTWVGATNGIGLQLNFSLGMGSTYTTTAGSWQAGGYFAPTSSVNVVATNSATFYITGVQLEKGSTATSFDYRPYGTELALCQRYFEKSNNQDQAVNSSTKAFRVLVTPFSGNEYSSDLYFKVSKRTAPTMTYYSSGGGSSTWTALPSAATRTVVNDSFGENSFSIACNGVTVDASLQGSWTASAEL